MKTKTKEELKKILVTRLEGLPKTGTKAYDMPEPADIDVYVPVYEFDEFVDDLKFAGVRCAESPYAKGIVFDLDGSKWNLFVIAEESIDAMRIATDVVQHTYASADSNMRNWLKVKANRYMYFKNIFNMLEAAARYNRRAVIKK